ncbi:Uncharacterized protein SCF082_LOCUS5828 [Durusdinium trenchii]|uniref:Apple domain-containing protein n=1 Tax=Durusdinium trenchii TaxID=1381693 RepID=A0ABP0I8K4_9DINO
MRTARLGPWSAEVYLYGYQNQLGNGTIVKIDAHATEEFTEERGFLPWREQRITLSYGEFFGGELRPTNLDAAVIELNADYESWVVPKSRLDRSPGLDQPVQDLDVVLLEYCLKSSFSGGICRQLFEVLERTWGELCMPVCPETNEASEAPCETSCFVEPGVPLKYPEYISHRSLAWKQGQWMPSPATVDQFLREGGQQWSATFECWDFQTGPEGFPICDGFDPKSLPDELGVWQVVSCPDGEEIIVPPLPNWELGRWDDSWACDTCMKDLKWAMQVGIFQEPRWYPGLTYKSSADEFQALLHEILGSCPPPCNDEPHFQAVDGAIDRVCRGVTSSDNSNSYFTVRVANSTEQCKQLCRDYPGCKGIEFARISGRCEIWLREGGIGASNAAENFECWRYVDPGAGSSAPNVTTTLMPHQLMYFEGLNGVAQDRVCRGANIYDNKRSYFELYWTSTLEGCKSECVEVPGCKGVEYAASIGRCEVWIRPEGIQAVKVSSLADAEGGRRGDRRHRSVRRSLERKTT